MICPNCKNVNKDTATVCRKCGCRLSGYQQRPNEKKQENKYLIAGAVALIAIIAVLIMFMSLLCNTCGGCEGREDAINENVEGDWASISDSDSPSSSDMGGELMEGSVENPDALAG